MLKLAGYINLLIAAGHLAALPTLDKAFALVGVGDAMEQAARVWEPLPAVLTVGAAVVFAVFGLYALAAAGVVRIKLPLMKFGIYAIGTVYVVRGVAGLVLEDPNGGTDFLEALFSLCALGIGLLYLAGGRTTFSGRTE